MPATSYLDHFGWLTQRLLDHLKELDRQVDELELQIVQWHRQSAASSKLAKILSKCLI
jgi:transposase